MDHMNKQQAHADWLQRRREKYTKQYLDDVTQRQKLEESRQVSQKQFSSEQLYDTTLFGHGILCLDQSGLSSLQANFYDDVEVAGRSRFEKVSKCETQLSRIFLVFTNLVLLVPGNLWEEMINIASL